MRDKDKGYSYDKINYRLKKWVKDVFCLSLLSKKHKIIV